MTTLDISKKTGIKRRVVMRAMDEMSVPNAGCKFVKTTKNAGYWVYVYPRNAVGIAKKFARAKGIL